MQCHLSVWQIVNVANEFEAWVSFLQRASLFCNKHGIQVLGILHNYLTYGRSARLLRTKQMIITSREKYIWLSLIKLVKSLIYSRFDKVNMKFLSCTDDLSVADSFAYFDTDKVQRLVEFYPPTIFQALT
jgi:hypothetical protein